MTTADPPPCRPAEQQATQSPDTTDVDHKDAAPDTEPGRDDPGPVPVSGTMPMARRLLDPATEAEIQALAAEAGPMTEDQRATLARLLRLRRPPTRRR